MNNCNMISELVRTLLLVL